MRRTPSYRAPARERLERAATEALAWFLALCGLAVVGWGVAAIYGLACAAWAALVKAL